MSSHASNFLFVPTPVPAVALRVQFLWRRGTTTR
jgi:hypothetical protein